MVLDRIVDLEQKLHAVLQRLAALEKAVLPPAESQEMPAAPQALPDHPEAEETKPTAKPLIW